MKKTSIFLMAAMGLAFVACNDETKGIMQTNPQVPVLASDAVTVAIPAATANAVSLSAYENDENGVPVLDVTELKELPAGYDFKAAMQYAADADFAKYATVPLTLVDGTLYASVEDWETAHLDIYSKNPRTTQSWIRTLLYADNGASTINLGNDGSIYFGARKLNVTPLPAEVPVEDAYVVLVEGASQVDMIPNNPDDVYNPPIFKANIVVDGTAKVKVQGQSGTVYGAAAEEGKLAEGGDWIVMSTNGPNWLEVNMEELTWKTTLAVESLWAYNASPAAGYELTSHDYVNYNGFAGFRGTSATSFRLASQNVANPAVQWGLDEEGEDGLSGLISQQEQPVAIPLAMGGCKYISVNLTKLTYNVYPVEYFGVIGSFEGSDWNTDIVMTHTDRYFMEWTADITLKAGDQFKIRTNGDWEGPDLGGGEDTSDYSKVYEHGANFVWNGAEGVYTIVLDLSKVPYSMTVTAK